MHSPAWIEARTLRLPDDKTPVELNAHPRVCMIQRTKSVRLTFPVTILMAFEGIGWGGLLNRCYSNVKTNTEYGMNNCQEALRHHQ